MPRYTPDRIEKLGDKEIFVFGSNLAGRHAGGAAFDAATLFGAQEGVGEGLTGRCYAFPTLWHDFRKMEYSDLASVASAFYRCVKAHPELTFLLTRVGCGIAGYDEEKMKTLFVSSPDNLIKPRGW